MASPRGVASTQSTAIRVFKWVLVGAPPAGVARGARTARSVSATASMLAGVPGGDVPIEGFPLDQLHDDEVVSLVTDDVVDGHDPRVVEDRGGPRLAEKMPTAFAVPHLPGGVDA